MGPLTLSEVLGTWTGLGGYAIVRGLFWWVPAILVVFNFVRLISHGLKRSGADAQKDALKDAWFYLVTSLFILAFFWPEALRFGGPSPTIAATEVVSQAAADDGGAVRNAAQVGSLLLDVGTATPVPVFVRRMLQVIIDGPVRVARAMHESATRPFSSTMPLNWLLRHKLDSDVLAAVHDWVDKCVLPAKARLLAAGQPLTYENMLPFGSTALVEAMAGLEIVPTRGGFLSFLRTSTPMRCDSYGTSIEDRVLTAIATAETPGGQALDVVWNDELGISSTDAARMLIYREVLATAGPEIPAPSLISEYALVRGVNMVGGAINGTLNLSRLFGPGPHAGIAGSAQSIGNELGRALEALSGLIQPALFVTLWAPELLGMVQMVVLLAFPVVIFWCLVPGQQFRPIFVYFTILVLIYSSPIWWAAIELWTTSLGDLRPSPLANPQEWLRLSMAILIGQTVGIAIVAAGLALVVFTVAGGGALAAVRLARGHA